MAPCPVLCRRMEAVSLSIPLCSVPGRAWRPARGGPTAWAGPLQWTRPDWPSESLGTQIVRWAVRTRVGLEGAVVREHPAGANRGAAVEPGEEGQFLQVVAEAVRHCHGVHVIAAQWITDFEIGLAAGHLTGAAPGCRLVVCIGVIHPFGDLMGCYLRVE